MHKILPFAGILLIASLLFISCSSSKNTVVKRLPGVWQTSPIVIDGDSKDWPSPYPEYDEKAMLGYAVSNDKENLYITVETGDPATQLKILREGLTVWIDRTAQKSEETAINYPIPLGAGAAKNKGTTEARPQPMHQQGGAGQPGSHEQQQRMQLEDNVRAALGKADQFSLQGFKTCNLQYAIMEKDSCGIEVKIGLDSMNELVWEAKVPFRSFYFKPELSRADKGKPLTVCFETTGLKRQAGDNANDREGGGIRPSIGMGGMAGMGMRMGSGGRGANRGGSQQQNSIMESLYKSTKTYKKFGLAFQ